MRRGGCIIIPTSQRSGFPALSEKIRSPQVKLLCAHTHTKKQIRGSATAPPCYIIRRTRAVGAAAGVSAVSHACERVCDPKSRFRFFGEWAGARKRRPTTKLPLLEMGAKKAFAHPPSFTAFFVSRRTGFPSTHHSFSLALDPCTRLRAHLAVFPRESLHRWTVALDFEWYACD